MYALDLVGLGMYPRFPIWPTKQAIGFLVADYALLYRIPFQRAAAKCLMFARMQVAVEMWPCSMSATGLDRVRSRRANLACGREWPARHVSRDPLRSCPRDIRRARTSRPCECFALVDRREVVAHHARLQRAFVAVEGRAPGILRIGRLAPAAVLPDDLEIAEIEGRCLRVGDVRLAGFVDENSAVWKHSCGQPRSSIQRTMSSMWMHMSPTMPLPYSMKARQRRGWTSVL